MNAHQTPAGGHAPADAAATARGSEREALTFPPAGPAALVDLVVVHHYFYPDYGTGRWRCRCRHDLAETGRTSRPEVDRLWREHLTALLATTQGAGDGETYEEWRAWFVDDPHPSTWRTRESFEAGLALLRRRGAVVRSAERRVVTSWPDRAGPWEPVDQQAVTE